jgi:hypothetical protein
MLVVVKVFSMNIAPPWVVGIGNERLLNVELSIIINVL